MKSEDTLEYNLITTSDSALVHPDKPNLLMGIWCTYQNVDRPIRDLQNFEIAPTWFFDSQSNNSGQFYVNQICNTLLYKLTPILNKVHSRDLSIRSWEAIVGPWLSQFVGYIVRRASTLEMTLDKFEIASITHFEKDLEYLAINETCELREKSFDPVWQSMVDALLIDFLCQHRLIVEKISIPSNEIKEIEIPRKSLKEKIALLVSRLSTSRILNPESNKFFLQATYLPYLTELLLHLRLLQLPRIRWVSTNDKLKKFPLCQDLREFIITELSSDDSDVIETCVNNLLPFLFPRSLLEGFQDIINQGKESNLPAKPKTIFTSNSFAEDEVFKVWTAFQIQQGVKYVVGQHGNNYGTLRDYLLTEQKSSDAFLTWGWSDDRPNTVPMFNLKSSGQRPSKTRGKNLLLIQDMLWNPTYPRDSDAEFAKFLKEQFNFVSRLPLEIRSKLIVRLHHTSSESSLDIIGAWETFLGPYPEVKLDNGYSPLRKLMRETALVVHGYDSTGILETLSLGIPSIAFIPGGLSHLNQEAHDRYQRLVDAGLIFLDPDAAATGISAIVQDLPSWWMNEVRIQERDRFVAYYSRISNRPAKELSAFLRSLNHSHGSQF